MAVVLGERALCAGTCSGCVPYEKQNIFYTLKKCSFLLPGSRRAIFRPFFWVGALGLAGEARGGPGSLGSGSEARTSPFLCQEPAPPDAVRLVWTPNLGIQAERPPHLD